MNKLAIYFKQAWNLIKQEKLFSSIYIIGTGLSITIVMVMSIVYYIRIANIYPETNRNRMLRVTTASVSTKDKHSTSSGAISLHLIESCIKPAESAEAVTAICGNWEKYYVQPDGSNEEWPVVVKLVDTQFWKVFPFRFINGKPFTEADMQSGVCTAVMAESFAKRLFGTTEAAGRQINLNNRSFRICGVVKDASFVTEQTFSQLWFPYTSTSNYRSSYGEDLLGAMSAYILAPSAGEVKKVKQEILANVNRLNNTLEKDELNIFGQPDRQWQTLFRSFSNKTPDFNKILWQYGLFFLVLLLVPAVGLSGMADSRMERRMAESGVRRAFGAPVRTLIRQIVTENFLFTILGGIAGLLFSYLIILLCRSWILQVGLPHQSSAPKGIDILFTPAMLLNLPIFAIALSICFILNLLAAIIPAWRYANREIVHSLNAK